MKQSLCMLSLLASLALVITGCSCHAGENNACATPAPEAKAVTEAAKKCPPETVKTAVTPSGEVLYIVAICSAGETCSDSAEAGKTAQCWKDRHHRHWCAKPLKQGDCKEKAGAECYQKTDGSMKAVEQNAAAVNNGSCKEWCVKAVKECPAKSGKTCEATKHVTTTDHQTACAPADVKKAKSEHPDKPAEMADSIVEDDFFIVSAY